MGQEERRQREKDIRRQDIIDAAERVFFTKGYESATMDDISKEAEYSKRTVYLHFSSKEQLYFEAMTRGYRLLIGNIEKNLAANRPGDALGELRCIFDTYFRFSEEHPSYFKAIVEYETEDPENQTGVENESKAECYRLGERMFGYLAHALQRGAAEGTLRGELAGEKAALTLWAFTVGVFNISAKKGGYLRQYHGIEPGEFAAGAFEMVTRLLCGTGGERHE